MLYHDLHYCLEDMEPRLYLSYIIVEFCEPINVTTIENIVIPNISIS
jgi:hypothetical protein